jgi:glycosyltransferase involved in cell wall biosynthesis
MQDNPTVSTAPPGKRITIITVVWNGADLLPGTIESVRRQTWPFIEYILIDGASKDASLEVIRLFEAEMPNLRWLSEPDQGLYDAMNKGLRMATGDFVWFLNAGDHLFDPSTVEKVAEHITEKTDVLYGDTMLVNEKRIPVGLMSALSTRSLPRRLTKKDYLGGMRVVHQSFVARHSLCPPYRLDNLCADYDWCLHILEKSRENVYTGLVLSSYLMGGLSKKRHRQSLRDRFTVMRSHFGLFSTLTAHFFIVLRAIWHKLRRRGKAQY